MPDHIPLPAKQYSVIYADPPWAYQQAGAEGPTLWSLPER